MRNLVSLFILAVAGMPAAATGQVTAPSAQTRPATAWTAASIVTEIRSVLSKRYVDQEKRAALDAVLAAGLRSGRYTTSDANVLAERINADLKTVGQDRHLTFTYNPQQARVLAAQQSKSAPDPSGFHHQVRQANHGISELRLLPGNVRYLDYRNFWWIGDESGRALDAALAFLRGGDAIIIDLRRNGGGSADASEYLMSHLLAPKTPLYTYYKEGGESVAVSTPETKPAGFISSKPLYLLTSNTTASAAEEFTGTFAGYRLGEVIGETTGGAGHAAAQVPIGDFVLSLSIGRVVLASTGRSWEGTGIAPTIYAAAVEAKEIAHAHALRNLAGKTDGQERIRLLAMAEGVAATITQKGAARPLEVYSGTFGSRRISASKGQLYYRLNDGMPRLLIPLGGDLFTFADDPYVRVQFSSDGSTVNAFELLRPGQASQGRYERRSTAG